MDLSIITVNFNNAAGLLSTIQSVLSQSYRSIEFLVIDGGSTDDSLEVIQQYLNDINYWVSERDKGIYDAMNKGIKRATGEYLMFLNSGDSLSHKLVIEELLNIIKLEQNIDVLYGDIGVCNHPNPLFLTYKHPNKLDVVFFKKTTINHQASLIRRKLFDYTGLYPLYYKLASDYWFYLKCFLEKKVFYHYNSEIVIYDFGGVSNSDGFRSYRIEQDIIWNELVPLESKNIVFQLLDVELKYEESNKLLQSRLVKFAIILSSGLQFLKRRIKEFIS